PLRQTDRELILRNADDREVAVPLNQIEEKTTGGSLMPEGLADTLTRAELIDLVRFLSELGKVGSYSVGQARVVRRWEVLTATPEARRPLQRFGFAAAAGRDPELTWTPAYSTVAGELPRAEVPALEIRRQPGQEAHAMGFVRCQLEATTGGKVRLRWRGPEG